MSQQQHEPLATIDGNLQMKPTSKSLDPLSESNEKPTPAFASESQQHQSLHSKLMKQQTTGQQAGAYVSPSDDIMSPASSKLNAFKQKRFANAPKPKSLFAKMSKNNASQSATSSQSGPSDKQ